MLVIIALLEVPVLRTITVPFLVVMLTYFSPVDAIMRSFQQKGSRMITATAVVITVSEVIN